MGLTSTPPEATVSNVTTQQTTAPDTEPLILVDSVDFAYSDRLVLKRINLQIMRGRTVGIIGPNGGGKTTLIRLMVGLLKPTRGVIRIAGLPVEQAAREGNIIGYLPQRLELNRDMPLSCRQLMKLCGRHSCPPDWDMELLACVGLEDLSDRPIGALSGGQFQRLLIARALASSPQLLVLDEPTTGIDAESREQFVQLLRRLKQQLNLTIVMSSHDLHTVHQLCDEVACLNLTMHLHQSLRRPPATSDFCNLKEISEG